MQLGCYTIEGELGRGGIGVVCCAGVIRAGRAVATKFLCQWRPGSGERFQREARLHIQLGEEAGFVATSSRWARGPRGPCPCSRAGPCASGCTPARSRSAQPSNSAVAWPARSVFALGAVIYECLSGQPPFDAPTYVELIARIARAERPALRSLRRDVPAWLVRVVDRAMAVDPTKRYPDAAALHDALAAGGPNRRVVLSLALAGLARGPSP